MGTAVILTFGIYFGIGLICAGIGLYGDLKSQNEYWFENAWKTLIAWPLQCVFF